MEQEDKNIEKISRKEDKNRHSDTQFGSNSESSLEKEG